MDHQENINNDIVGVEEEIFDDSEVKELVGDSCSTNVILQREPCDRYNIVYILFYFFGITSLMPWNFLITANDYWMYKFRDTRPLNGSVSLGKTEFQAEFTSYLNMATALPNMTFLILNSLFSHLIPLNLRMGGSLLIITISFLATTAFVQIDTDDWQTDFFIITLTIVAIMTAASAVLGGSLFGVAGKFAPQYMAAVVSGQALGGIIAAVAQILSLAFKISALHSALIYFLIADVMIIASLIAYICLCKIDFFTHHILKGNGGIALNRNRQVSYVTIIKKIWIYLFSIGVIFVISISVYPAVTVLIESHNKTKGSDWNSIFFVPVVNYLIFNCSDYAGRIVAGLLLRPFSKAWIVGWASALRVIGVPLLMMCNAQPRLHLPVIIQSDWQYIILMAAFAFSNGYLTNITFINSAKIVEQHEKEKASSMMAAALAIGLTVGAALSMVLVKSL